MAAGQGSALGVLVVDKPLGLTSFDVVQRVRRLFRAEKAGHTGTLDPLATGVLPVCLGEAVKLQQFLTCDDKEYLATVALGAATDTADGEGQVIARGDPGALTHEAVQGALSRFLGEIDQIPPMYSAIRIGGRRLHEAARAGEHVERTARRIRIDRLELQGFEPAQDGIARARLLVRCSKGTYVRTLATDLGDALGVPAHLAALRRTVSGLFTLEQSVSLDVATELARQDPGALQGRLVSCEAALGFLPALHLDAAQARDLGHGKQLPWSQPPAGLLRALDGSGRLLAVCEAVGEGVRPVRVFSGF
jgi:tRNA pseudouridine55 synthase